MELQLEQVLVDRLGKQSPKDVLLIAPTVSPGLTDYFDSSRKIKFNHIVFCNIEQSIMPLGRFDFVIVADTVDQLEKAQAEQMISRLRDLHAKLLWVMVPSSKSECYNNNDAIAQGMRMVNPENFGVQKPQWYEFSLQFYKPVPQWLNSKNWANPEQWDKSRW